MITLLVTLVLVPLVAVLSMWNIIYWWIATRGAWRHWAAGRAQMALLASIALITATSSIGRLVGYDYPGRSLVYLALYIFLCVALIYVGVVIRHMSRSPRTGLHQAKDGPAETREQGHAQR